MKLNTVLVKPLDAPDWIYVPHETFPLKAYAYFFVQRKKKELIMLMHKFLFLTKTFFFKYMNWNG